MPSEGEKRIIEVFVKGYNSAFRASYSINEWPEEVEQAKRSTAHGKVIDALAVDSMGKTLAIEHTSIDAFEGARGSDARFYPIPAAFKDPSQCIPEYHIIVSMRLDSVFELTRAERNRLGQEFERWFRANKLALPDGLSRRRPKLCGRTRTIVVNKRRLVGFKGLVSFQRYPKPPFLPRLRKALCDKVPKLSEFDADSRVLLLERRDYDTPDSWGIARELKRLKTCRKLSRLNEIWLIDLSQILFGDSRNIWGASVWPTTDFNFVQPNVTDFHG